jgi:glutathione synthase/RimK-type ligase-like ATP-grasp enzyme
MTQRSPAPPGAAAGPLLIAGGDADHSLLALRRRALTRGFEHVALLVGAEGHPDLTWDLQADRLELDGREIRPGACFIRYDVFTHMADKDPESAKRAAAWYAAVAGWLQVHPEVRILNRHFRGSNNKPYLLHLARQVGLEIPVTRVSNDLDALERWSGERPLAAKPVQGGAHCREMADMLATVREAGAAAPFITQNRLAQPEMRLYRVGSRFIAFWMRADVLDYRTTNATQVVPMPLHEVPPALCEGLGKLMDLLEMDYGAADFKTDPDTGRLLFLELNSSPMFFGFDLATGGAVSDAILAALTG